MLFSSNIFLYLFFPAVLISVLMIAFNMLSNSLRDALDPKGNG